MFLFFPSVFFPFDQIFSTITQLISQQTNQIMKDFLMNAKEFSS